jgi:hypothetical protein
MSLGCASRCRCRRVCPRWSLPSRWFVGRGFDRRSWCEITRCIRFGVRIRLHVLIATSVSLYSIMNDHSRNTNSPPHHNLQILFPLSPHSTHIHPLQPHDTATRFSRPQMAVPLLHWYNSISLDQLIVLPCPRRPVTSRACSRHSPSPRTAPESRGSKMTMHLQQSRATE